VKRCGCARAFVQDVVLTAWAPSRPRGQTQHEATVAPLDPHRAVRTIDERKEEGKRRVSSLAKRCEACHDHGQANRKTMSCDTGLLVSRSPLQGLPQENMHRSLHITPIHSAKGTSCTLHDLHCRSARPQSAVSQLALAECWQSESARSWHIHTHLSNGECTHLKHTRLHEPDLDFFCSPFIVMARREEHFATTGHTHTSHRSGHGCAG
jgi:hypothetical protein